MSAALLNGGEISIPYPFIDCRKLVPGDRVILTDTSGRSASFEVMETERSSSTVASTGRRQGDPSVFMVLRFALDADTPICKLPPLLYRMMGVESLIRGPIDRVELNGRTVIGD